MRRNALDFFVDGAEQAKSAGKIPDRPAAGRHRARDRVTITGDIDAKVEPLDTHAPMLVRWRRGCIRAVPKADPKHSRQLI
jgi:hypothetical protein